MPTPLKKVVIVGDGLAAQLTALALQQKLSNEIELILLKPNAITNSDCLYGNVAAPDIYDFHLQIDLNEPELLLNTNTTFAWGHRFKNWALSERSWVQCFHLPLPVEDGVEFHQFFRQYASEKCVDDYLISAQAAIQGKFAHPPEDKRHPLSRAEYGYQYCPSEWSTLYASKLDQHRIEQISGDISNIKRNDGRIELIELSNGNRVGGDLFIDCSGLDEILADGSPRNNHRAVSVVQSQYRSDEIGPAYCSISSDENGWQSSAHLQDRIEQIKVSSEPASQLRREADPQQTVNCFDASIGHKQYAWVANCVAIGQAANILEPLSHAPTTLLIRDIQRLLELIPHTTQMTIEATEYNRRFAQDAEHAQLFHDSLFAVDQLPEFNYWQQRKGNLRSSKLERKLAQFKHRGVLVNYDLEPFSEQDWLIQHLGMGRRASTVDTVATRPQLHGISTQLDNMRKIISQVSTKMPTHQLYIAKLLHYLKQNHATNTAP